MPVPDKQAVAHYRGDSLGIKLTCWNDKDKTIPTSFIGATVTSQLREKLDDPEPVDTYSVSVSGNIVTLRLTPQQTTTLPDATIWDVQVDWLSDGASVQTIKQGTLSLTPDVTHA